MPASRFLLGLSLLAAVLMMRGPVACVGPVASLVMREFSLSYAAFGVLTALPIAAFGLFSFAAHPIARATGSVNTALAAALATVLAGCLLRLSDAAPFLYAGTIAVGAGIALLNVSMPVVLRARFPDHLNRAMGVFTAVISISGALGAWSAAPLAAWTDSAIAPFSLWSALGALAFALWLLASPARGLESKSGRLTDALRLLFRPAAWPVILTMGMQSLTVYTVGAWLPTLLADTAGFTASQSGAAAGIFLASGFVVTLATDEFLRLCRSTRTTALVLGVLFLAGIALWLTGGFWAWAGCVLAGAPQGLMFSVALIVISQKSPNSSAMMSLSAAAQGMGYLLAGLGPWVFGLLFGASGVAAASLFLAAIVVVWTAAAVAAAGASRVFP